LDCVRWELLEVDARDCTSRDDVAEHVAATVGAAVRGAGERLLVARVVISGVSEAHSTLAADAERLRYEVIAAAADVAGGQVWIESVKLATSAPRELANGGDDAVGELVQELAELSAQGGAPAELSAALAPLAKILPPSVLAEFDPLDAETIRALMADVSQSLPVALLERTKA
jgi:DNA repair protein SbcD/Mre11